ncbi:MAG: hypothetical protein Q8Q60_00695 [Candidatus Chromulinivorax sp.]|nr:hypothetical protein [Candidatus Chromulinivorax sp.]
MNHITLKLQMTRKMQLLVAFLLLSAIESIDAVVKGPITPAIGVTVVNKSATNSLKIDRLTDSTDTKKKTSVIVPPNGQTVLNYTSRNNFDQLYMFWIGSDSKPVDATSLNFNDPNIKDSLGVSLVNVPAVVYAYAPDITLAPGKSATVTLADGTQASYPSKYFALFTGANGAVLTTTDAAGKVTLAADSVASPQPITIVSWKADNTAVSWKADGTSW